MVMEGVQEEVGSEGNMQCTDHPFMNNAPGGICAFCLQEKLGKLVSSSLSTAIFPSSSSSSTPSFRSDLGGSSTSTTTGRPTTTTISSSSSITNHQNNNSNNAGGQCDQYYPRRAKIPFLLAQKKKKKKDTNAGGGAAASPGGAAFRRSKSTTTPRRTGDFLNPNETDLFSPRRRRFWSFLHLSKHSSGRKIDKSFRESVYGPSSTGASWTSVTANVTATATGSLTQRSRERKEEIVVVDENESPNVGRKVSRSRSVGCGSRSFSGDILDRISTGLGDCTLRRVESQREGRPRVGAAMRGGGGGGPDCMKETVKCGGIFGGFTMTSSSSSSSSSSNWVSSSAEENVNGGKAATAAAGHMSHGRNSRSSWGWAFASPMRAFAKTSAGKTEASNKNTTPNLAAVPSLLAVRG